MLALCKHLPKILGLSVPKSEATEALAGGLQTQNVLSSVRFNVVDGVPDVSALADSAMFTALSPQGQSQVLQQLKIVIAGEKFDRGVINVFERVKCTKSESSVNIGEWISAGPNENRQFFMVKFACNISSRIQEHGERAWRQIPVILMQTSEAVAVDQDDNGYIKQQFRLLPSLVIWRNDAHSAPKPECILHDCMCEEGPLQCIAVPDIAGREWHHGRKRVSSRAGMRHDELNPYFFKHPGQQSSNWF